MVLFGNSSIALCIWWWCFALVAVYSVICRAGLGIKHSTLCSLVCFDLVAVQSVLEVLLSYLASVALYSIIGGGV